MSRLTERNIKWFEKNIKRYKFDDFYNFLIRYSLIITNKEIFDTDNKNDIFVFSWNINSLILAKIYSGEPKHDYGTLSHKIFLKFISIIQELETYSTKLDLYEMLPKLMSNQFLHQQNPLIMMYRSNYFYNYKNSELNMQKEFNNLIGHSSENVIGVFYAIYLVLGSNSLSDEYKTRLIDTLYFSEKYNDLLKKYTIDYIELYKIISKRYDKVEQLVLGNIHLNPYCFISYNNKIYLTFPHNLLSSYFYGTYHRLINHGIKLREAIGKNLLEDYLYKLVSNSGLFDVVQKEKMYFKNKNEIRTPDVLALKDHKTFLFEIKSSTISLDLRDANNVNALEQKYKLEARKIHQIMSRINDYTNNLFDVENEIDYDVFGLIINYESSNIDKRKIFETYYREFHNNTLSSNEKETIENSIRFIDLYNLETIMLFKNNLTFFDIVFSKEYSNRQFSTEKRTKNDRINDFQLFIDSHHNKSNFYIREILGIMKD